MHQVNNKSSRSRSNSTKDINNNAQDTSINNNNNNTSIKEEEEEIYFDDISKNQLEEEDEEEEELQIDDTNNMSSLSVAEESCSLSSSPKSPTKKSISKCDELLKVEETSSIDETTSS